MDWQRTESVFHACVDKSAAEQQAILDAECGADHVLRSAVERLLRADADGSSRSESIRQSIASELESFADDQSASFINAQLGPWRIVDVIGQGGMGVVYSGRRDDDRFEKKVAIKVLRTGFAAPSDVERFRRERRILAGLEHQNIARLIDGGEVSIGGMEAPYIVMEFVDGHAITTYCDQHQLDIRARLQLFMHVLDAVQYAHQHLVLHRDLSPSNILVTAEGHVKLLDFGIATLISSDDQAPSPVETRAITPAYSSPEQARGGRLSAATDVFSLGAVLYQLLTGREPHTFSSSDPLEIIRAISDDPPAPPHINDDLDNVVMKALQKEPARRYGSAAQLAEDVKRYLDGRAVLARPDTLAYRAKKFVLRNRWAVSGTALFAAAVILGVAGTVYQARRANLRADELQKLAGQVLFQVHDSIAALPGATEARSVLVKTSADALDRLASDAGDDPGFLLDLAASYERLALLQGGPAANVGALDASAASYRKATAIYARLPPNVANQPDTLRKASACWVRLGSVLMTTGHLDDAKPALERGVELAERSRAASGTPSIELVDALRYSGDHAINSGSSAKAMPLYQKASTVMEELAAREPTTDHVRRLAVVSFRAGEAEIGLGGLSSGSRRIAAAVERIRALMERDPKSATFGREIGIMTLRLADTAANPDLLNLGNPSEGLAWAKTAVGEFERLAKADPANARGQLDLAQGYASVGSVQRESDPAASMAAFEQTFAILDKLPPATRNSLRNKVLRLRFERGYGAALANAGSHARAVPALQRTLAGFEELGAANFTDDIGFTLVELARSEYRAGDKTAAKRDLERAITSLTSIVTVTLDVRHGLANALLLQSQWLAADAATCGESAKLIDRASALWREMESSAIAAEAARREREAIEARSRPVCR